MMFKDTYEGKTSEFAVLIDEYRVGPVCFHYFTGGPQAAAEMSKMATLYPHKSYTQTWFVIYRKGHASAENCWVPL